MFFLFAKSVRFGSIERLIFADCEQELGRIRRFLGNRLLVMDFFSTPLATEHNLTWVLSSLCDIHIYILSDFMMFAQSTVN